MVLHHVAQSARAFIITRASLDPERFRRGDLDMIDVAGIPERLENGVREPENENVLRGFLPEKMIDPIGLLLGKCVAHDPIQLARGGEIGAERFFDNDPRPASFARLVQPLP